MKKIKVLFICMLMFILVSCSANNKDSYKKEATQEASYVETDYNNESPKETSGDGNTESSEEVEINTKAENRKIIVSYNLVFDTKNFDSSINSLNKLVTSNGGYHTWIDESTSGTKNTRMIVQIPADQVNKFLEEISSIEDLNLVTKNLNSEDVTDQYADIELRLKTLRDKLARLNELQKSQSSLEQLLQLETEISNTIYEIEKYEGSKSSLDSKVNYTEINISINEIGLETPNPGKVSFGSKIAYAFTDSINNFKELLTNLIISIIYLLPLIVFLAILIPIISFIVKRFRVKFPKSQKFDPAKFRKKQNPRNTPEKENINNIKNNIEIEKKDDNKKL